MDRAASGSGAVWGAWLASIRIGESVMLQAFPFLGMVYAGRERLLADAGSAALLLLALSVLYAHIFALNDWANFEADQRDPRKTAATSRRERLSAGGMQTLALALGAAALVLFACLPPRTWPYALWFFVAGLLYSLPRLAMKGVPLVSSGIHLVSGTAHFLVGVSLFRPVDRDALLLGLWCGLVLAAGHMVQEVQDHDGDRAAGVATNAVRYGKRAAFLVGAVVFGLTFAYLGALAAANVLPPRSAWLLILYPGLAFLFWRALRRGLDAEEVWLLRRRYRLVFACVIAVLAVGLWQR